MLTVAGNDSAVVRLAARARVAYLAVETGGGPHVTPVLFAATHDRLWFAVPRDTLKARVLRRRPAVGVLIHDGASALVVGGTASLLDPARPAAVAGQLAELARAPLAVPAYALRNAGELAGFAQDAAREPARLSPAELVLASVRPRTLEVVPWPRAASDAAGGGAWKGALAGVPQRVASLPLGPGPAVLGWLTPQGPLALPAAWDGESAHVHWPLLAGLGAPTAGPACVCFDTSSGRGPRAKHGLLLRGEGRARGRGETRRVTLAPDRITYWTGFDVGTIDASTSKGEPDASSADQRVRRPRGYGPRRGAHTPGE
jgi:pyridoxamine 5'-phosphate oxidase-like protein